MTGHTFIEPIIWFLRLLGRLLTQWLCTNCSALPNPSFLICKVCVMLPTLQGKHCVQLFVTSWTVAHQSLLSMELSRQLYWSGLPFPSSRDLCNPGIQPGSPAFQAVSLPSETAVKPILNRVVYIKYKASCMLLGNGNCLVFIGRTDADAEAPILWPPDEKNWLIGKDPDSGKDCSWEEKGMIEFEMVGWHHWLDGHEFE